MSPEQRRNKTWCFRQINETKAILSEMEGKGVPYWALTPYKKILNTLYTELKTYPRPNKKNKKS